MNNYKSQYKQSKNLKDVDVNSLLASKLISNLSNKNNVGGGGSYNNKLIPVNLADEKFGMGGPIEILKSPYNYFAPAKKAEPVKYDLTSYYKSLGILPASNYDVPPQKQTSTNKDKTPAPVIKTQDAGSKDNNVGSQNNNAGSQDNFVVTGTTENVDEKRAKQLQQEQESQFENYLTDANLQISNLNKQQQDIENSYNTSKSDLESLLKLNQTASKEGYAKLLRKNTKNASLSKKELGNVYASLGTTDSSAFQDKYANIDRTALEQAGEYNRASINKEAEYNTSIENNIRDTNTKINAIKTEARAKIEEINNNKNKTREQKLSNIAQINYNLDKSIETAKTKIQDFANQLKLATLNSDTLIAAEKTKGEQSRLTLEAAANLAKETLKTDQEKKNEFNKNYAIMKDNPTSLEFAGRFQYLIDNFKGDKNDLQKAIAKFKEDKNFDALRDFYLTYN